MGRLSALVAAGLIVSSAPLAKVVNKDRGSSVSRQGPICRTGEILWCSPLRKLDQDRLAAEAAVKPGERPLYGNDNRMDWFRIDDPVVKARGVASVALIRSSHLSPGSAGLTDLSATPVKLSQTNLCPDERFADQLSAAYCSGVLVESDVVLTAGHCLKEVSGAEKAPALSDVRFVFGFFVEREGARGRTQFAPELIYEGREVIAGRFPTNRGGAKGEDWALVRLDRSVPAAVATAVPVKGKNKIPDGASLEVLGYPSGLPLKYAVGGAVRKNSDTAFFVTNLSTFQGNSGSGVFDSNTGELVGILARGEIDYYFDESRGCARPYMCPKTGCRGEDVVRVERMMASPE